MSEEIEYTLTVNVEDAMTNLRQFERLAMRTVSLIKRLSGSEQLDALMRKIQEAIIMARTLQIALMFARMGTPFGWASSALTGGNLMAMLIYDAGRGY